MKKKQALLFIALMSFVVMTLAYFISGVFLYEDVTLLNVLEIFEEVLKNPFRNHWNEKTIACLGVGFIISLMMASHIISQTGNFMFGNEHGNAKWANIRELNKRLAERNEEENRILSKSLRVSFEPNRTNMNNNIVYIGGSGKGKGFNNIIPNLANGINRAHVVTDSKGDTLRLMGHYLEAKGQEIRTLNLIDFEKSLHYNPFRYLKNEEDIDILVDNIMENTKANDNSAPTDQFWEDGPKMLMVSIFDYLWMEYKPARQNWTSFFELMDQVAIEEEKNEYAKKIAVLERTHELGANHPAVKNYNIFKNGAAETMGSILMILAARLRVFRMQNVQWLMQSDELNLYEIGTGLRGDTGKKVSLFMLIPDENIIYSPIVGMIYTQLFQILFEQARENGGKLPFYVVFDLDEYANIKMPADFIREIATIRSRRICANIYLQSISQIKALHKDDWEVIFGNCDTMVYLGSGTGEKETFEYISELLGEFTIHKRSTGVTYGANANTNSNIDVLSRKLMLPAELRKLSYRKCIVLLPEADPVLDDKYDTKNSKWFKEMIKMGDYEGEVRAKREGTNKLIWTDLKKLTIEFLTEEEQKYFREQAEKGNMKLIELDEESLMQIDFSDAPKFDETHLKEVMLQKKPLLERMQREGEREEGGIDLSVGSAYDWLVKYPLNDDQREEIIQALEDRMTDDEIREFYNPEYSAKKMSQLRRLALMLKQDNRANG